MSGKKEITHIDLAGMTSVGKAVGSRAITPPTKTKGSDKPAKGSMKEKQISRKTTRKPAGKKDPVKDSKPGQNTPVGPGQGKEKPKKP
jgi:hypothetical protein